MEFLNWLIIVAAIPFVVSGIVLAFIRRDSGATNRKVWSTHAFFTSGLIILLAGVADLVINL